MKVFKQLIYSIPSLSTEEMYNLLNPTDHAKFFSKIDELCDKINNLNNLNAIELKVAAVEYLIEFEKSQQNLTIEPSIINTPTYPYTPMYPTYVLPKVYCYNSTNMNYD